ncbi:FecR family protein [Pedobacter frigoris]|uniref:FecR family protein n=1 Tax=Pedobacter frigoris TaxID=2571272 RepID=UPI00292E55BE|nr:FecR family protein [Pedobacter frigoris]
MNKSKLNLEELLSDADFINYCLDDKSAAANKWENYVPDTPEDARVFEDARKYVALLTGELPEEVINTKLELFKQLFESAKNLESQQQPIKLHSFRRIVKMGIAASLILIAGYFLWPLAKPSAITYSFEKIDGKQFDTDGNARKVIKLADGTEAILFPRSKLIVSNDFNEKDRKVAVYGQVYLKIFHNKQKPFIAYSKFTTTTAIGTSFYVRDFANSKISSVLLVEGKVKVQEPNKTDMQFLEPGMSVEVDQKTLSVSKKSVDKEEISALADHKLHFDNTDMNSIVSKLELFHGIEIDLSMCECNFKRITGDYSNSSLTSILNTISYINHVSWTLVDHKVIFKPIVKSNKK